jgi:hypothetical protein
MCIPPIGSLEEFQACCKKLTQLDTKEVVEVELRHWEDNDWYRYMGHHA